MDLNQLADLGDFIGGAAVLVTLVYLAVQMRQTTRQGAATLTYMFQAEFQRMNETTLTNPEHAELLLKLGNDLRFDKAFVGIFRRLRHYLNRHAGDLGTRRKIQRNFYPIALLRGHHKNDPLIAVPGDVVYADLAVIAVDHFHYHGQAVRPPALNEFL